ncbi:unnamed protein product [Prorocentrum cordatum]|uniref:Uncharacterized protein n=1 Tax=Prorocentrum cordatum TaxID=2364126 RepID=A0ABN9UZE5_9DINO|nr:unnamed protein product [Polarella glacialis]
MAPPRPGQRMAPRAGDVIESQCHDEGTDQSEAAFRVSAVYAPDADGHFANGELLLCTGQYLQWYEEHVRMLAVMVLAAYVGYFMSALAMPLSAHLLPLGTSR